MELRPWLSVDTRALNAALAAVLLVGAYLWDSYVFGMAQVCLWCPALALWTLPALLLGRAPPAARLAPVALLCVLGAWL